MALDKPDEQMLDLKRLEEDYEDSFLRLVMHQYIQVEGDELERLNNEIKDNPRYEISPEAVKRINKSLDKYYSTKKLQVFTKKSLKILYKVGIVLFAFFGVFIFAYFTVDAFRVQVLNFLVTIDKEYTAVSLGESESNWNIPPEVSNMYVPSYIPEGYWLDNIINEKTIKIINYINGEGKTIKFREYNSSTNANFDSEDADIFKSLKINGVNGLFVLKNEMATVSWKYDDRIFAIYAQLSEDEIVHIAESVIFVN